MRIGGPFGPRLRGFRAMHASLQVAQALEWSADSCHIEATEAVATCLARYSTLTTEAQSLRQHLETDGPWKGGSFPARLALGPY
jgi:hypothetical protein